MLWTILDLKKRKKEILLGNKRNRWPTIYRTAYPEGNQNEKEKCSHSVDWQQKKAYDIVPQTWIIECLKMYKISDKFINFIMKAIKNWKVELTARGKTLAEVACWRVCFQTVQIFLISLNFSVITHLVDIHFWPMLGTYSYNFQIFYFSFLCINHNIFCLFLFRCEQNYVFDNLLCLLLGIEVFIDQHKTGFSFFHFWFYI